MDLHEIAARIEKLSTQYAEVYGIERSGEWALLKLTEEVGELAQAHLTATGQSRDRGLDADAQRKMLADEVGDVLGMCLVYARQMGIDPVEAVTTKWFQYEREARPAGTGPTGAGPTDADPSRTDLSGADPFPSGADPFPSGAAATTGADA